LPVFKNSTAAPATATTIDKTPVAVVFQFMFYSPFYPPASQPDISVSADACFISSSKDGRVYAIVKS
jgi:hypothetical protein